MLGNLYKFSDKTMDIIARAEEAVSEKFKKIEEVCLYNQAKVLKAFADNHIGAAMTIWGVTP